MPAIPVLVVGITSVIGTGVIATAVATVVSYAVVGAVVGGLGAAVMGGDIGKGILYGAIGGAVMGGFSAYASWGSTATSAGTAAGTSTSRIVSPALMEASANSGVALGSTADTVVEAGGGAGILGSLGEGAGAALISTGGQMLTGAFDDSAEQTRKLEREKMAQQNKQFYAELEASERMSKSSGGSSSDAAKYSADLQLLNAREQRQADWKLKQKEFSLIDEQRARRRGALTGLQVANAPSGNTVTPSVQQQVYDESKAMYGEEQNPAESTGLLFGNK
jgi:hypothetical protein